MTEISEIYDMLYNIADVLIKDYNPCEFKDGICKKWRLEGKERKDGCCGEFSENLCKYHSGSGCTVTNLSCKLWFCGVVDNPVIQGAMKNFKLLSEKYGIPDLNRCPKEEVLKEVKKNSSTK